MKLSKRKIADRRNQIVALFYIAKFKKKDIAKTLGIHRNTVGNYLKKDLR